MIHTIKIIIAVIWGLVLLSLLKNSEMTLANFILEILIIATNMLMFF